MSARVPGLEAIEEKGWLAAHRWLFLRRASQIFFLALFMSGPWLGIWITEGTLASSLTLDILPLSDPFILLQGLAAGHLPELTALVGAVIVLAGYMLVGGRVYCSWVCPINPVSDFAHWLGVKLGLPKGWQPKAGTRIALMLMVLVASLVTGTVFWELSNPVTLFHRALVFGLFGGLGVVAGIFLFELLVSRRGWCSRLCPVGAFYGQINRVSLLRVAAEKRELCDDCMDCFEVCPEPQVIRPALKGDGTRRIEDWACTHCARCIDVRSKNVFSFSLPSKGDQS
ncbi:MAG: quinol dehydrogenase ferredoxin subunit NapH [Geminicoccaceae bacterium]